MNGKENTNENAPKTPHTLTFGNLTPKESRQKKIATSKSGVNKNIATARKLVEKTHVLF